MRTTSYRTTRGHAKHRMQRFGDKIHSWAFRHANRHPFHGDSCLNLEASRSDADDARMSLNPARWTALAGLILLSGCQGSSLRTRVADTETVGHSSSNRTVRPVNQVVTPLGRQVELPGLRPQVLVLL